MSVIVKGMEMPTSCTECPCCRHDNWNGETAHQCNVSFITFGAEDENWIYDQRPNWCPLVDIPTSHGDLVDLSNTVHPNDSMKRMTIDEQLRRTCEGWSADRKQYVIIEAEGETE